MGLKGIVCDAAVKGVMVARAKILAHVVNSTAQRSAHKVLRKPFIYGKLASAWYPTDNMEDPIVVARREQERLTKLARLKLHGKCKGFHRKKR